MAEEGDLRINGKVYDPNSMTFREQRDMRRIIRDDLYDGAAIDQEDLALSDILPAMALVLVRRDDPTYTLDAALDLVPHDVLVSAEEAAAAARPTPARSRARKKTSAVAGPPS